jgi:SAM-dependent methyltransferase
MSDNPPNSGVLKDCSEIWDERYAQLTRNNVGRWYEPWLEPWLALLETSRYVPILDIGCGCGLDARYLSEHGFRVIAADYSQAALRQANSVAWQAGLAQADLRQGLPFSDQAFEIVIANLSLHYFHWPETEKIVRDLQRCLRSGGHLLTRVNSTKDYHYGAAGEVIVANKLYLVRGGLKRFFDRQDIDRLFGTGWVVHVVEEKVIHCYHKPKVAWEIVLQKN